MAILFLAACLPLHAEPPLLSQYAHQAWRTPEDLPGGAPHSIAQSSDGFIWVGTTTSLLRFDGVKFAVWQPRGATEPYRGVFHTLFAARDNSLWVSRDLEVDHIVNGNVTTFETFGFANAFVETPDGTVWAARSRGHGEKGPLCSFSAGRLHCFNTIAKDWATSLALDADGTFWLGTDAVLHTQGEAVLRDGDPAGVTRSIQQVNAMAAQNGEVWAGGFGGGSATGLLHYKGGQWTRPIFTGRKPPASASVLHFLADGSLLIGTEAEGLFRVANGILDHLDTYGGLSGNAITAVLEDHEHQIWIATDGGVDKLRATSVRSYALPQGLISGQVTSVLPLRSGSVLIGCIGGLDQIERGKVLHLVNGRQLPGSQVTAMFEDSQGRIWIGVDQRLFLYRGGHFQPVAFAEKDPISVVRRITEEPNGTIWVLTTMRPNIFKYTGGIMTPDPKLRKAQGIDIVGNAAGLWFSEHALVRLLDRGAIIAQTALEDANDLADDRRGGVWMVTLESLSHWDGTRIISLSRGRELPPDKLISATVDSSGSLWISTTGALLHASSQSVDRWLRGATPQLTYRIFGPLDGFQPDRSPFRPRIAPALDGTIWFAQETRAQSIDPRAVVTNRVPPPVFLTGITADRRSYQSASTVSLPSRTRDLRLEYTALSFAVPAAVQFRYRLDGWDQSWQEAGNRRDASYTNLPPGQYRFHVLASNNDGVWNQNGTSAAIVIPPAFYQTAWFTACLCGLLLFLSWFIFRLRLRSVTNKVTHELTTRLRERERIARELHDTLLQGFQGLILKFQLVLDQLPPSEAVREELESALQLSDQVMVEGRRRVLSLRNGSEEGDLVDSFREAEPAIRGTSTAEHRIEVHGVPRKVQPVILGEICAIWKEAAGNAFRHSHADQILTEVSYTSRALILSVEDDGVGMGPQVLQFGKRDHWGLQGMRERAQDIGARVTIQSSENRGTKVYLRIDAALCYTAGPRSQWWGRLTRLFGEKNLP